MANTLRESTAAYRSDDAVESAGSSPIPALGFGPHNSTSVDGILQELRPLKLPVRELMICCIASAVDIAYDSHSKTHGSTVSLIHGNIVGQKLYSVSIYPSRTINLWTSPTWQELFSFVRANLDLLLKPSHTLSSWLNDWSGEHVLDVAVLSSDRDAALALGLQFNQPIFNLEVRRVIAVPRPSLESTHKLVEVGND